MDGNAWSDWPSGGAKAVLASKKTPADLVAQKRVPVFRDRDDLDWFDGARLTIEGLGLVIVMRHENNPLGLTAFYVDLALDPKTAEDILIQFFSLPVDEACWRLSDNPISG